MFRKIFIILFLAVSPALAEVTFDGTTMTGAGTYSGDINVSSATNQTVTIVPDDTITLTGKVYGKGTVYDTKGKKIQLKGSWSEFTGTYSGTAKIWTEIFTTDFKNTVFTFDKAQNATQPIALCTGLGTEAKTFYLGALTGGESVSEVRNSGSGSNGPAYLVVGSSTSLVADADNVFNGKFIDNNAKGLGIEKTGSGTWTLTNTGHNYSLGTKVSGGTLRLLGAKLPAGTVTINSGATLKLEDSSTAKVALNANTNYVVNGTLWFDMKNDRKDFTGKVTGSGTIVKTQDGTNRTLTLGSDFSGFSGTIDNQSVRLIELKDTIGDTSKITLTSTVDKGSNAAYVLWATTTDSGKAYKTFTFKSIEGNNNIGVSDYDKAKALLRVGTTNASDSTTFNAVLCNYGGNAVLGFEKTGASTLTLTQSPTFTGGLTVSGGKLIAQNISLSAGDSTKFLQTTHSIEVKNGATLQAVGGVPINPSDVNAGYRVFANSTTLDIASGGLVQVEGTNNHTYINDTITVTGSGVLDHGKQNNNNKLIIQANLTNFTGTVRNTSSRFIELYSKSDGTVQSDSVTAIFDSGTGGQGFAFWAVPSNKTVTFELGALIGNGNCLSSDRNNGSKVILKVGTNGQSLIADADNVYKNVLSSSSVPLAVEKVGNNTWTLTTNQTYVGGTTVSGGTLLFNGNTLHAGDSTKFIQTTHSFEVKNGGTLQLKNGLIGDYATIDIAKGGKFVYDTLNGDRVTPVSAVITGSGEFIHSAASTGCKLQIKSDFTGFTGTVRNEGGRYIELFSNADGTNISTGAGAIYDSTNPSGGQGQAFAFVANTTDVSKPVVFEMGAFIGSCLSLASGFSTTGAQVLLKVGSDGETLISNDKNVLSGVITRDNRTVSVEKVGTNTWTLTGNNTYTGSTTITGGTLKIGNGGTTGNIESKVINLGKAGTLELNRSNDVTWSGIKLTTETNGTPATPWSSTVAFNPTTDAKYITSNLVKNGAGTFTLTLSADTPTELYNRGKSGTDTGTIINSNIEIGGGTLALKSANTDNAKTIAIRGQLTGTGTLLHSDGGRKMILFGDNTRFAGRVKSTSNRYVEVYSSKATSADAIYEMNGNQGLAYIATTNDTFKLGALIGNNPNTISVRSDSSSSANANVEVGSAALPDSENVYCGNLGNSVNAAINYTKVGDGQWTLTGTSQHTGTTTVDDGTLYLTSTAKFTGSPITVNDGGTLILQGTLGKDLTVNGELEIDFTQGGTTQEASVAGNLSFGESGQLSVNVEGMTVDDLWGASYKLTSGNSFDLAPLFNEAVALGNAPSYMMVNADGSIGLNYNAVPEPATWVLLVLGAVGLLLERRFLRR